MSDSGWSVSASGWQISSSLDLTSPWFHIESIFYNHRQPRWNGICVWPCCGWLDLGGSSNQGFDEICLYTCFSNGFTLTRGNTQQNSEVKFGNLSNTIYVQVAQRFDPHSIPCFVIRTWFSLMLNQIHLLPLPGIPRNTIVLGFIKPYQYGCVWKWVTRQRTIFIGNMIETRFWTNWKLARSICRFKDYRICWGLFVYSKMNRRICFIPRKWIFRLKSIFAFRRRCFQLFSCNYLYINYLHVWVVIQTYSQYASGRSPIFSTSSGVRLTAAPFAHSSPQSQLQHVGLSNFHRLWCLETFLEAFKFRFFYELVGKVVWLQLDFFPPHICVGFLFFAVHSCPSIPSVLRRPSPTQLSHTQLTHS